MNNGNRNPATPWKITSLLLAIALVVVCFLWFITARNNQNSISTVETTESLIDVLLTENGKVTITVDSKWDDGFAKNYASDVKKDADGKTSYEFTDDQYKEFMIWYSKDVRSQVVNDVLDQENEQYTSLNDDGTEFVVGINSDYVEKMGVDQCKKEAQEAGQIVMKYNMNTKNPTGKLTVIYRDANTGRDYFAIDVTAE